jgi:hypothetical protein
MTWTVGPDLVPAPIANAGENEEIVLASFDVDEIRAFRKKEEWRLNYLRSHR